MKANIVICMEDAYIKGTTMQDMVNEKLKEGYLIYSQWDNEGVGQCIELVTDDEFNRRLETARKITKTVIERE